MKNSYRFKTMRQLVDIYIDEHKRINKQDAKVTQTLVEREIRERTERLIRCLKDKESLEFDLKYKTQDEEVDGILKWIINIA